MTGFYRPPPPKSASKASASTLCQKCLKRGHYSYECKGTAQNRPYTARPSRTQQLLNPKLAPKLSSDVPNDLLRKKGVADEQLAQLAAERGRKRSPSMDHDDGVLRKRSRSAASDVSSSSVSTISTNRSRSPSPRRNARQSVEDEYMTSQHIEPQASFERNDNGKRRRSPSYGMETDEDRMSERNTRRRRGARSPDERGRGRRRRSIPSEERGQDRYTHSQSRSRSRSSEDRQGHSSSPQREEWRRSRQSRSRSRSPYARNRRAPDERDWRQRRTDEKIGFNREKSPRRSPPPKERSLSPYSKRLALTRAAGRRV